MDSFHLPPTTFELINVRYINNLSKGKFLEAFYLGFPTLLKHTQINIVKVMLLDTFQSIYLIKSMFMFIHKHCNKYLLDVFFFRIFFLWKTIPSTSFINFKKKMSSIAIPDYYFMYVECNMA